MLACSLALAFAFSSSQVKVPKNIKVPKINIPALPVMYHLSIQGVKIDHPFRDGLLDAGDSVYVHYNMYVFNAEGLTGNPTSGTSAVMGWTGNKRVTVKAGDGADGGLKANGVAPSNVFGN